MYDELWTAFYKNIEMIDQITRLAAFFRRQNFDRALRLSGAVLKSFQEMLPYYVTCQEFYNQGKIRMDLDYVSGMLGGLLDAQENQDYVLLADLYELQVLPFLLDLQESFILEENGVPTYNRYLYKDNYQAVKEQDENQDEKLSRALSEAHLPQWLEKEGGYHVEYTSSGEVTMKVTSCANGREYYLHSNAIPSKEAFSLASAWYQPEKEEYIVYGLGFGYHILALHRMDTNARIEVYESDINTIQMAAAYAQLRKLVENPQITLHYDKDLAAFSEKIKNIREEQEVLIYHPSLYCVKDIKIRESLENYFIQYSSVKNQLVNLNGNFRNNLQNYTDLVDVLKPDFEGKRLYIVAAGPSLDLNYEKLRNVGADSIILATETVFRKLMAANIRPDYVIATDANQRVIGHIHGLEECGVPFLFLSTAFKGFAKRYQGRKYILFQKDYEPAEKIAESLGATLFETGGSVATTALDLGIRFGCKEIIFLGLDLSYPGGLAHAEGTSRRKLTEGDYYREVEDIFGGRVKTNRSMDIYRKWMEKRIGQEQAKASAQTVFIDATEGGAKIAGMQVRTMDEVLKEERGCPRQQ